jgi:hypothetical protein
MTVTTADVVKETLRVIQTGGWMTHMFQQMELENQAVGRHCIAGAMLQAQINLGLPTAVNLRAAAEDERTEQMKTLTALVAERVPLVFDLWGGAWTQYERMVGWNNRMADQQSVEDVLKAVISHLEGADVQTQLEILCHADQLVAA